MAGRTIRIYEADWVRLAELQAIRARQGGERPSYADLVHEALDRLSGE